MTYRSEEHTLALPPTPYRLHFVLRAMLALLESDPVLRQVSAHVEKIVGEEHAVFKRWDQGLHDQELLAVTGLYTLACDYFEAAVTGFRGPVEMAVISAMRWRLDDLRALLTPGRYDHHRRRAAAREVRGSLDLWGILLIAML